MKERNRVGMWILCCAAALAIICAPFAGAQAHPAAAPSAQAPSENDVAETQTQFLKLLRLSPVLTTVVARDPSLLADQAYVARNNPELAQFIAAHPDIAKNPDFYLFSNLENGHGRREEALERVVWPDLTPAPSESSSAPAVVERLTPLIGLPVFFIIVFLIVRLFVENRRWSRNLKVQSEIHGRLIDKLSTSQDLAAYMETEAGKRFLAASSSATGPELAQHMPNAVARVLTPLQIGVVLTLLGAGLLLLRHAGPDTQTPMLVLGTLALMPGIGFILSAGATWIVAKRLGMLPENDGQGGAPPQLVSHDRQ
jgi:hypothetical protein